MNLNILGYTFVGLWETALGEIPVLDNKFCLDLFGDPYSTKNMITPEGLVISKNAPVGSLSSSVIIGTNKLQVADQNLNDLITVIQKLVDEFRRINSNIALTFLQYGLNFEIEVDGLGKVSAEWMGKNYLGSVLSKDSEFEILGRDLSFQMQKQNQIFTVQIQPRFNKIDALYIIINDHRSSKISISDNCLELNKQFANSFETINSSVFKALKL